MKLQEQKIQQAVALLILLDQGFIKLKINETQKSKIQLIRVLLTGGDCNIAITPGASKSWKNDEMTAITPLGSKNSPVLPPVHVGHGL